jgi:TonB family protein
VSVLLLALIALQLPGQSTRPTPRGIPNDWLRDSDYPDRALKRHQFGRITWQLDVDAAGKAIACHIFNSSGFWELDNRTCTILLERARFEPGRPGTFQGGFVWEDPTVEPADWEAIVALVWKPIPGRVTVKALPKDYVQAPWVRVRVGFGAKRECHVERTSGNAAIDGVACDQAMANVDRSDVHPAIGPGYKVDTRMFRIDFVAEEPAH